MIGSTTTNGLLTRIAVALAWRRNEDVARRLAGFAATEAGSALDMLKAAELCDDPTARRLFFRHALDEARHAQLFQRAAHRLSPEASRWSDYAVIHATRQNLLATMGFVRFLAFVYIAESKAAEQFDALRKRFADQPEIAELFETVLKDERFHVAYSKHLLDELSRRGRSREVRAALRAVRWGGAWQAWRRAGRRIGDVIARGMLLTLYVAVVPVFAGLRRVFERDSNGWQAPAKPPRSLTDARRQS